MKLKILYTLLICAVTFISTAQLDRSKAPVAQPNPGINIPKPNVFTLENGLQVIVVENHKQPKVSFQLYIDHTPLVEANKAGLSSMFGELLGSGTKSVNKDEFDENIDFMGASFSPSSRGFFASSLSKHTPQLLYLLSKVVLEPAFTND
jgi:zinc protease